MGAWVVTGYTVRVCGVGERCVSVLRGFSFRMFLLGNIVGVDGYIYRRCSRRGMLKKGFEEYEDEACNHRHTWANRNVCKYVLITEWGA
jgi:hypothetical protein